MEPLAAIPLDYQPEKDPWRRILTFVAALSLVFGLMTVAENARFVYYAPSLSTLRLSPITRDPSAVHYALSLARIVVGALIVIAALGSLIRISTARLILAATKIWLALWCIGVLVSIPFRMRIGLSFFGTMLLGVALQAAFPLLVVFLLREYGISQQAIGTDALQQTGVAD